MAASVSDIRNRKIPNVIVICAYVYGLARMIVLEGMINVPATLVRCVAVMIIFYLLYLTDAIGAGDVKLYSVIPLYYRRDMLLQIYLLIFCVAAVYVLGRIFLLPSKRKCFLQFLNYLRLIYLRRTIIPRDIPPYFPDRIPMALPMAIGVTISMIFENLNMIEFF